MKKVIFSAYFLVITIAAALAQTQKGNVLVGADLMNFGLNFQKGNTQFQLNVKPKAAWFIDDNLALGAEVLAGLNTQKGATSFNYGVGALARKYFGAEANNLTRTTKWFAEGNLGFYGTNLTGTNLPKTSTNGIGVGLGPGLAYFLTQNIALEALAKYNLTIGLGNSTTNNNLGFGLGFQIYLPGKQVKQLADNPIK